MYADGQNHVPFATLCRRLIMVLAIVCYALLIPMIFTADPKESRAESPCYVEFEDLHAALPAEDDAAVELEMAELDALVDANDAPVFADAANNVYETLVVITETPAKDPAADAITKSVILPSSPPST